jgi:pimeloyl-ACP methyl ester carboxylesterase
MVSIFIKLKKFFSAGTVLLCCIKTGPCWYCLVTSGPESLFLTPMTESEYVQLEGQRLHYLRMGQGSRLLLAFHGYSNQASLFSGFTPLLGHAFTIISIDLPHHGRSQWPDDLPLRPQNLQQLVTHFLEMFGQEQLSLMGYSLGGRVCLSILGLMPRLVDRMLLIAPDGLAFNPLYFFVTRTWTGKRIFRHLLTRPEAYFPLIDRLRDRQWINTRRHRFVMNYVQSEYARSFLLRVWPGLRLLIPPARRIKAIIRKHHIPVYLFMGRHDHIIPLKQGVAFQKGLPSVHLHVLDKGHRLFDPEDIRQMAQRLLAS